MLLSTSGAQAAAHRGAVLVKDINPGRSPSVTAIYSNCGCHYNGGDLTNVRGTLYFSANDGKHGFELWRSDGTARGTRMVKDINPGTGWSNLSGITAVNRIVYLRPTTASTGPSCGEATARPGGRGWSRTSTPGSAPAGPAGSPTSTASSTSPRPRATTPASCGEATAPRRGRTWSSGSRTRASAPLIDVNGTLYFGGFGGFYSDLWRSDGTEAGTSLVKPHFVNTLGLTDFNGTLYFSAGDANAGGSALWRSDGTEAGTTMVKDFGPGSSIYLQATSTGTLYFTASLGPGPIPNELWRSDGTEAGTTLVKHSRRGLRPHRRQGQSSTSAAGRGYGEATAPRKERLSSGETSPAAISVPSELTATKSALYFAGTDKRHGEELWRSNGTRKGTTIVRNIRRGTATSDPGNLTAVGDTLFFTAKDGRHGRELWRAGPKP